MRKGEELKTPRHASAAATRDDRLPYSRHWQLFFLWLPSIYKYCLTSVVSQVYPVIPCTLPPIKPSYETAICRNLPYSATLWNSTEFC